MIPNTHAVWIRMAQYEISVMPLLCFKKNCLLSTACSSQLASCRHCAAIELSSPHCISRLASCRHCAALSLSSRHCLHQSTGFTPSLCCNRTVSSTPLAAANSVIAERTSTNTHVTFHSLHNTIRQPHEGEVNTEISRMIMNPPPNARAHARTHTHTHTHTVSSLKTELSMSGPSLHKLATWCSQRY
jgi:hypothetical protein